MNNEVTIEDIEEFRSNALVAHDFESAAVCCVALGDNGEDIRAMCPPHATDYNRVHDLAPYQETAWDLATQWVLSARAMNND